MRLLPRRSARGATRRDLEVLVRERTAELELAIEQMESADTIIDRWGLDGVIHYMNDFGLATLGYTADEVIGKRSIFSIVPDDPERLAEWVAVREQLEADPHRNVHSELQCRHKDGSAVWIAFRNRPILDADDNIVEVFSVGIDITERKRREAALAADNRRMVDELAVGRQIQRSMLAEAAPAFPGCDQFTVRAVLEPAREVGGDFYDYFLVDDDHLCVCVGDVSDKGVPAALFMAVTKTLVASRGANDTSPAGILRHVNDELCRRNDESMFVTLVIGVLDTRAGIFRYANAGHNPPIIRRADGGLEHLDARHGPVAGVVPEFAYPESEVALGAGDLVLLFTDGVTESMDREQVAFGEDRLLEVLSAADGTADGIVSSVLEAVAMHATGREPYDDVTILALGFHGPTGSAEIELVVEDRDSLRRALRRFDPWLVDHGIGDDDRRTALTVTDELLSNVLAYAEPTEPIQASITVVDGRLSITVRDDGPPFNPFEFDGPDTRSSLDDRSVGGLGIHLTRSLMDEHEYERVCGRNVVRLSRRLATSKGADR